MRQASRVPVLARGDNEFDRVFNRFFGTNLFGEPFIPALQFEPKEGAWVPKLDLTETETEYVARLEIPGVPKENFDVNLTGDLLTISGHREQKEEKKGETYLWQEQKVGEFSRTIRLPAAVTANKIDAIYKDGVLTVHLPKMTPEPATKISVK
jgi:HSP20 family protein